MRRNRWNSIGRVALVATAITTALTHNAEAFTNYEEAVVPQPVVANEDMMLLFLHGPDNTVWWTIWDGYQWYTLKTMNLSIAGEPGAASWGWDRVDVFARGSDNALYQAVWINNGFEYNGWYQHPDAGFVAGNPHVASAGPNELDVLFPDVNGGVTDYQWNGQWNLNSIPIPLNPGESAPGVTGITATSYAGNMYAFWVVPPGYLGNRSSCLLGSMRQSGSTSWSPAVNLGDAQGQPSAVTSFPDIRVYAQSDGPRWTEASLLQWNIAANYFADWSVSSLGSPIASSPNAVAWNGQINVFFLGTDGSLWNQWYTSQWNGFSRLNGGAVSGAPTVVTWGYTSPPNRLHVFFQAKNGTLINEWWDGSNWNGYGWLGAQNVNVVFPVPFL